MELIVLKGDENTGKTTTINWVCNDLRGDGYIEPSSKIFRDLRYGDFLTVLQKGEVEIGIISQGDEPNEIPNYLKEIEQKASSNNIKVICALRKSIENDVDLSDGGKNTILGEIEIEKKKSTSFENIKPKINQKVEEILALV
jgi:hypothetical protein